jgi:Niemann-Pick C1 protein
LEDERGKNFESSIRFTNATNPSDRKIIGYKLSATTIKIESTARQGPPLLTDIRWIEDTYSVPGTFSYGAEYLSFEQYFTFFEDSVTGAALSIMAVLIVILFITASFSVTMLVALAVLLVDLYLLAMIFYWGLTFNSIVVVNICIAIGLSVDYSAHIAHTYLIVTPPPSLKTKPEIRKYKAAVALS